MKPLLYLLAGILIGIALMLGFSGAEERPFDPGTPELRWMVSAKEALLWDCETRSVCDRDEAHFDFWLRDGILNYDQRHPRSLSRVYVDWATQRLLGRCVGCERVWPLDYLGHYEVERTYGFEQGYPIVHTSRIHFGRYGFDQPTWDSNVVGAGYPEFVGVRPDRAPAFVQDSTAYVTFVRRGWAPWPWSG